MDWLNNKQKWIVSIIVIIVSILVDILVFEGTESHIQKQNSIYRTALKTEDKSRFNYIVDSQQGKVVTHSKITSADPVKFPEMNTKNKYMLVKRTLQEYTPHNETTTDSKGNTHTKTYWTWDDDSTTTRTSKELIIFGRKYKLSKFDVNAYLSNTSAKELIKGVTTEHYYLSYDRRYEYQIIPSKISASFISDATGGTLKPVNEQKISLVNQSYKEYLKRNLDSKTWLIICGEILLIVIEIYLAYLIIMDGE